MSKTSKNGSKLIIKFLVHSNTYEPCITYTLLYINVFDNYKKKLISFYSNITNKMSDNLSTEQINQTINDKTKEYKAKNWVFTQWHYEKTYEWISPDETIKEIITYEEGLRRFAKFYCSFMYYSHEEATKTKGKHLQGCFVLRKPNRFDWIKKRTNQELHIEKMDKKVIANIVYCSKGTDPWEHKDENYIKPKPKIKKEPIINRYKKAFKQIKSGKIMEVDEDLLSKHLKNFQQIQYLELNSAVKKDLYLGSKFGDFFKNHFIWIKGTTGTLKSYNSRKISKIIYAFIKKYHQIRKLTLNDEYTWLEPYIKDLNKWFQNYKWEKIMIIEEIDPTFCKNNMSRLKRMVDQYAFPAEYKGGDVGLIRPEFIIFTSNFSMAECFNQEGLDYEKDYAPMKRRILEVEVNEKSIIKWPNLKLLICEYDIKDYIIKYENEITVKILELQNFFNDDTFKTCTIDDHNKLMEEFLTSEFTVSIKKFIKEESNFQPETDVINGDIVITSTQNTTKKRKGKEPAIDNLSEIQTPKKSKKFNLESTYLETPKKSKNISIKTTNKTSPLEHKNTNNINIDLNKIQQDFINTDSESEKTFEWKTPEQVDGLDDIDINKIIKQIPDNTSTNKKHDNHTWIDKYGIKYQTEKQLKFISPKFDKIFDINNKIKEIITKMNQFSNQSIFVILPLKDKLKYLINKKQQIINNFKLNEYSWKDNFLPENYNGKCWYCNHKVINQCACNGKWKYIHPQTGEEFNDPNESNEPESPHDYEHYKENDYNKFD